MKFLVDANLSSRVASRLCDGGGYEALYLHQAARSVQEVFYC